MFPATAVVKNLTGVSLEEQMAIVLLDRVTAATYECRTNDGFAPTLPGRRSNSSMQQGGKSPGSNL
jgi:hypothetical protein